MIKAQPVMGSECVASHMAPGRTAAAEREPAEEYPQQHSTKTYTSTQTRHTKGEITRKQPAAVATPLPPLNPKNRGKRWPAKAERATRQTNTSPFQSETPNQKIPTSTGMAPFKRSPPRVMSPSLFPATRNTLYAPMFLLPADLTSTLLNMRVQITPHGTDPRR